MKNNIPNLHKSIIKSKWMFITFTFIVIYNDQSDIGIIKSEFLIFDSSFEIQYVNDNQLEPDDIKILVYKKEYS